MKPQGLEPIKFSTDYRTPSWVGFNNEVDFETLIPGAFVNGLSERGAFNVARRLHGFAIDHNLGLGTSSDLLCVWDQNVPPPSQGGRTHYNSGQKTIYLDGYTSFPSDTSFDEWDAFVISHEYAHHIQNTKGEVPPTTPVCATHQWSSSSEPNCAYSEGFANWYACVTQASPRFLNYHLLSVNPVMYGSFLYEHEKGGPYAYGEASEQAVATMLWDVYDTPNDADTYNDDANEFTSYTGIGAIVDVAFSISELARVPYNIGEFCEVWRRRNYPLFNEPGNLMQRIGIPKGIDCQQLAIGLTVSDAALRSHWRR